MCDECPIIIPNSFSFKEKMYFVILPYAEIDNIDIGFNFYERL